MEFIEEVREFIAAEDSERDYARGAMLMLKCNRNRMMYNQISRRPERWAKRIVYELQKWLRVREAAVTHTEVAKMQQQADTAIEKIGDDGSRRQSEDKEQRVGKRPDHDSLPLEIQSLYIENLDIARRMRECHMQARNATGPTASCIDSEKFGFLSELIALDKKLHSNWQKYDTYVPGQLLEPAKPSEEEAKVIASLKMTIGRYSKKPSESMRKSIVSAVSRLSAVPDDIALRLKEAGLDDIIA